MNQTITKKANVYFETLEALDRPEDELVDAYACTAADDSDAVNPGPAPDSGLGRESGAVPVDLASGFDAVPDGGPCAASRAGVDAAAAPRDLVTRGVTRGVLGKNVPGGSPAVVVPSSSRSGSCGLGCESPSLPASDASGVGLPVDSGRVDPVGSDDLGECPYEFTGGFDGGAEESFYGVWFADEKPADACAVSAPSSDEWLGVKGKRSRRAPKPEPGSGDAARRRALFNLLQCAKESAIYGDKENSIVSIGGRRWVVQANGVACSGNRRIHFPYYLVSGGVSLLLRPKDSEEVPVVRVVYGVDALKDSDLMTEHNKVVEVLKAAGFRITREALSRVDLQATLSVSMEEVASYYYSRCFVSRVRKWTEDKQYTDGRLRLSTLTGSKGAPLMLRIYDKVQQMTDTKRVRELGGTVGEV